MTHSRIWHPLYSLFSYLGRFVLAAGVALLLTACVTSGGSTQRSPQEDARRAQIRVQLAIGYMQQGQWEAALGEIQKALDADSNSAAAYTVRGLIYSHIDELAQAEQSFRRAVAISPRDGDALHNLGWLLCTNNRPGEGRQYLESALKSPMYQGRTRTEAAQGICEMKAGNIAQAERFLIHALDTDPHNAVASGALAELYFNRGDFRRAALYASQANVRKAATPASLWLAMKIERSQHNHEGVARYARQLRDMFPNARQNRLYQRGAWNE